MNFLLHIVFLSTAVWSALAAAQEHHSTADIFLEFDHYQPGMKVGLYIELEPGWHTYWINPGQTGMGPIFTIAQATTSEIVAPTPKRISTITAESFAFEHEVLFYRTIELAPEASQTLHIQADWLVCKDICIPNSKQFTIPLQPKATASAANAIFSHFDFPKPSDSLQAFIDIASKTLHITNIAKADHIDAFPASDMDFAYAKPISRSFENGQLQLQFDELAPAPTSTFLLATYDQKGFVKQSAWVTAEKTSTPRLPQTTPPKMHTALWMVFVLAFVGGFLLNLMPCVFPVVSIKFFNIASLSQKDQHRLLRSNLIYSLGVMTSFIALAFILVFLRSIGEQLGWGFQLQSPSSVALMTMLFYIIGLNFLGVFETSNLPLPAWIQQSMHRHGYIGDFFTGVFTTIVASPCTAPFMAASIGYALSQSTIVIFFTFLMLGLGLSLPYILLAVFPAIAKMLPKPGPWMQTMKEILAFPMLITCAWLIWVYSKLTHHGALLYLLISLVLLGAAFYSLRWAGKKPITLILIMASVWLALWPHQQAQTDLDLHWIEFSPATIQTLQAENHWIFVDFTADWCLTCKANEVLVLGNKNVRKAIRTQNIQMVKADWTQK
ncbi:MAG: thioredoxin family protein, partial [Deltaproteobacteria bacterium]|nr:thioredoxin family protein [Deltaproteobacteria bacterium]